MDVREKKSGRRLDSTLLTGTATVVRNRSDFLDQLHIQTSRLERSDRAFSPRARTFHADFDISHAELSRLFGCLLCSTLPRERCALSASFEATRPSTRPAQSVPFRVSDGNCSVVERSVNMGNAAGDIAANSFLFICLCHCKVSVGLFG